ncbi:MAG: DNA repair exonuclease [Ruminiclostridium sp.]|nr:DNA repair exonuclease [Ruminiclostridium sp.]
MITFLHGADFHLDSPFHALSPEQAVERRQEQRQLLTRLADTARQTQAQIIFLAGDLFDSQRVRPETLELLQDTLKSLEAQVFISPGNHDPYTASSPYARLNWPSHVHIFSSPYPERVELPHLGAVVYGSAFLSSHRVDSPLLDFQARDEGLVTFGCFHGDTTSPFSRYGPITQDEIYHSCLDYLALGHHHTASGVRMTGSTYYAWPGCPEGRGFDETGDKGIYLGRVDELRCELDFLPLAGRQYRLETVDITGQNPQEALRAFLAQGNPQDILRICLTGERQEDLDLPALTALATPYAYHVTLQDETSLPQALWAKKEEDTLTGLFLRTMAGKIAEASPEERPFLERAVRFGLAALEGREEPK